MAQRLTVCTQPGCPVLTATGRCHAHQPDQASRNHNGVSRHARGHGSGYERARREMMGQPCALRLPGCTGVSESADYTVPGDWTSLLQPACLHCQRAQGGRLAARARGVGGSSLRRGGRQGTASAATFSAVRLPHFPRRA